MKIKITEGFINNIKSGSYVLVESKNTIYFPDYIMYPSHTYVYIEDILPVSKKIKFRFCESEEYLWAKYHSDKKRLEHLILIRDLTVAEKLEFKVIDYLEGVNHNWEEYSKEEIEYVNTYLKYRKDIGRSVPKITISNIINISGGAGAALLGAVVALNNYPSQSPIVISDFIIFIFVIYLLFRQNYNESKEYRFLLELKAKDLGLNK